MPLVSKTVYVFTACSFVWDSRTLIPRPPTTILFDLPYLSQILLEDFWGGGIWRHFFRLVFASVSKDRTAFIFKVKTVQEQTAWPWRWRQYDPLKLKELLAQRHGFTHTQGLDVQLHHFEAFQTCTFYGVRSCECDTLWFGRKTCFYQAAWHHVLSVTGTPLHGACFGFGWRRRPPGMEDSCEYIE